MNSPLPSALIEDRHLERPHQRDCAAGRLCGNRERKYFWTVRVVTNSQVGTNRIYAHLRYQPGQRIDAQLLTHSDRVDQGTVACHRDAVGQDSSKRVNRSRFNRPVAMNRVIAIWNGSTVRRSACARRDILRITNCAWATG